MDQGNEQIQVEFHNRANTLFVSICRAFEGSVSALSRRRDEHKFQQLKKQHAETLDRELKMIAKDVLKKHRNERQMNETDLLFHQFIKDYLHRFVQKVNDL